MGKKLQQTYDFSNQSHRVLYIQSHLLGLSIKDFCQLTDISYQSFLQWKNHQSNHFKIINYRSALQLVDKLKKVNIVCTVEWLLQGEGDLPYVDMPKPSLNLCQSSPPILKENLFFKEMNTLMRLYKQTVMLIHGDDAMMPFYHEGDYVFGRKYFGPHIETHCLNQTCIILTTTGIKILRHVTQGQKDKHFLLCTLTPDESHPCFESELVFAAPVLWHAYGPKATHYFNTLVPPL